MTDSEYERIADARVQRRLATDPRYRNAENAEEQAQAEADIEREVCAELDASIERASFRRRCEALAGQSLAW